MTAGAPRLPGTARCWLGVVLLLWAGVVVGVSFVAVPAKFMAPNLGLPLAMEVGREEFRVLNAVETGFALVALGLAVLGRPRRPIWVGFGIAAVLVTMQGLWLLPVLNARAEMIIQGATPLAAPWHALYVASEAVKFLVLLATAWLVLRPLRPG